jgi:EAL domain-containing protein (putative c-di-GMP-specific phosphodiesterase class I)
MSSVAPATHDRRFLDEMDRQLTGWDDPVARLRAALDRNELVLYAQPVVALRGAEDAGFAEVLVRLREEERALLPPGDFIPVFEHFRMMRELDAWIVRCAIGVLARGAGLRKLSVNVSEQTLDDAEFASFIRSELRHAGVQANALVFEVEERDALDRPAAAARFAGALKEVGCAVLLDGFGRRSVSFAPLTALQADYVKVDGVIVRKLGTSDRARAKLHAIVVVGNALGVAVIGESVEAPEPLAQLKAAGVGFAQGFGIGAPAPLEELAS